MPLQITYYRKQPKGNLSVSGILMQVVGTDMINEPFNQSVIFTREFDLVVTSDTWNVVIQFDLNSYEEAITTLHEEMIEIQNATSQSTQLEEVRRVGKVLDSLENKLSDIKQFLPKTERRRGLVNMAGDLLKILFGTATVSDLNVLHSTVDTLSKNQETVSHAVN